jgi:hypothetical protein
MDGHRLEGRRIAVLAADGFEKVELTISCEGASMGGREDRYRSSQER